MLLISTHYNAGLIVSSSSLASTSYTYKILIVECLDADTGLTKQKET
jgi:hypothetical protein